MSTTANGISRIEIKRLWREGGHIEWHLRPDVNILSGVNGVGKSTILSRIVSHLRALNHQNDDDFPTSNWTGHDSITIELAPADATTINFDVVRSFDNGLIPGSILSKIGEDGVRSELDWKLYKLQRNFLDYQVNVGNRIIQALTSGAPDAQSQAVAISEPKRLFHDIVDELFADTSKCIDRTCNELRFMQRDLPLTPYHLSSGEKQILIILLTVLLENNQPYVLFMDEPEVSLHIEWQGRLIECIRKLNPHVQIILTTHSPALVMDGWVDAVTEVSDIFRD